MAIFQKGRFWYIDYYNGHRRIREKAGRTKGEAQRALVTRHGEILQGRFNLPTRRTTPTFEQFAKRYLEFARTNKRGIRNEVYRVKALVRRFGNRRLSELSTWDAERFKVERSKQAQPATVNRELGNLKNMMSMAVKWGCLDKNPFGGVKLLRVPKKPERILTESEEALLLAACDRVRGQHLRPIVTLALHTGMRKGEILGLLWSQIDLDNRTIHIHNAKSSHGERRIPMNQAVQDLLFDLAQKRKSDFVFPSSRKPGERLGDSKVGFWRAVKLAGIPHIRFHDLRHTFATRLVYAGVDLITVQHLLGHANITMTARYAHALEDGKIAAVRRLVSKKAAQTVPNRSPDAKRVVPDEGANLRLINAVGV